MRKLALIVMSVFATMMVVVPTASAATQSDVDSIFGDSVFYDASSGDCNDSPSISSNARGTNIFVIGDSLTIGMRDLGGLEDKLAAKGWTVTGIEATEGDSIEDALPKLDARQKEIALSDTILIGLGTNPESDFGDRVAEMVNKIRQPDWRPNAQIYWINMYSPDATRQAGYETSNDTLSAQAAAMNFSIVNFASEASANSATYPFASDNIHHGGSGYEAKATFVSDNVGTVFASPGATNTGTANPGSIPATGTIALVGADNAEKIWNFLLTAGLSPTQAAGLMGNMNQESTLNPEADQGGPGGTIGASGNAYGIVQWDSGRRTALHNAADAQGIYVGDLGFQLVYMYNESVGRSVRNSQPSSGAFVNPVDAANEWEGLKQMQTFEAAARYWEFNFERSADTDSGIKERVTDAQTFFTRFNGTYGGTGGGGNCASSGAPGANGIVNTSGYSYPLEPQQRIPTTNVPCSSTPGGISIRGGYPSGMLTCHHDGTPAADISYGTPAETVGKRVYAIYGGRVERIGVQEPGWCYSIQLEADDGRYYWYGHLNNVAVKQGERVVAGQQMAEIAEWTEAHTCAGTSGGAHLHIDRGCQQNGQWRGGGNDDCRDPDFIPFLNQLYNELGEPLQV